MALSHEDARRVLDAGLAAAGRLRCPVSVAVLDEGRELIAFGRLDDATLASVEIAQNKAFTARSLNMSTADLGPLTQPGEWLWGIERTDRRPLVAFAGGLPLQRDGRVVGAVGVAGGSAEQDAEIVAAAEAAIAERAAR